MTKKYMVCLDDKEIGFADSVKIEVPERVAVLSGLGVDPKEIDVIELNGVRFIRERYDGRAS